MVIPQLLKTLDQVLAKYCYQHKNTSNGVYVYIKPIDQLWSLGVVFSTSKKSNFPQIDIGIVMISVEELLNKIFQIENKGITHLTFSTKIAGLREWGKDDDEGAVVQELSKRLESGLNLLELEINNLAIEANKSIDKFVENKFFPSTGPGNQLCHFHLIRKIVKNLIETGKIDQAMVRNARRLLSDHGHYLKDFDFQYKYIENYVEAGK